MKNSIRWETGRKVAKFLQFFPNTQILQSWKTDLTEAIKGY